MKTSTTITRRQKVERNLLLEQLKKTPIIEIACTKVGIARATYYRWRNNKKFRDEADQAIREGISLINDMAESQLLSAIKDKNITSIIFWLKNRHRAYADKVRLTGEVHHKSAVLSPEQEKIVFKALKLGNLYSPTKKQRSTQK